MKYAAAIFGTLFWLAAVPTVPLRAEEYRLGEGLQLGDSPVYLGGYFSLNYWHNLKETSQLTFDDAALMLYGGRGHWSFMAEAELSDAYEHRWGYSEEEKTDWTVHAERLYGRYEAGECFRMTLGKFNTPYGFWNLMPINVLRDTTSSPRVVETIAPRFTTGADIRFGFGDAGAFSVLLQENKDLDYYINGDNHYNNFDIDNHFGIGYLFDRGTWRFRLNGGYYSERVEDEHWIYGYAGFEYFRPGWHVLSEAGYKHNDEDDSVPRSSFGAYVQATRTLWEKHDAILRLEATTDYIENSDDRFAVFGYTYRPLFPVALKAEYQYHSREDSDRLVFSLSMLF